MLERVAGILTSATEALSAEEAKLVAHRAGLLRLYTSVIVTTAALKVCTFDPETISMADGNLPIGKFLDVDWLRFRKQLSNRPAGIKFRAQTPFGALGTAKEHTVFVVNAGAFQRFITDYEIRNADEFFKA